jgi:hypothetical protein
VVQVFEATEKEHDQGFAIMQIFVAIFNLEILFSPTLIIKYEGVL